MSEQSIPAARDLVGRVLEDIPERQHHCAGVAARAQTLAVTVPQAAAAELVAAAWLHDIGYIHAAARRVAQRLAAVGQRDPAWLVLRPPLLVRFSSGDQRANGRCTHGEVAASPPNNRPVFARRSSILRVRQTSGAPRSE
jgi:hypothetical protein